MMMSYLTSDIENKASYEAKSVSVSVGTSSGGMNVPGQGLSAALITERIPLDGMVVNISSVDE